MFVFLSLNNLYWSSHFVFFLWFTYMTGTDVVFLTCIGAGVEVAGQVGAGKVGRRPQVGPCTKTVFGKHHETRSEDR